MDEGGLYDFSTKIFTITLQHFLNENCFCDKFYTFYMHCPISVILPVVNMIKIIWAGQDDPPWDL